MRAIALQEKAHKTDLYIRPKIFSEDVVAGFSTRLGGVSEEPFDSLNLGLSTDDEKERVTANRRRLFESVGFGLDALAVTGQVHGVAIREIAEPGLYRGYDGLITRKRGVLLCLTAADCASVLLADEGEGIVGACHAGWRGAVGRIVTETVDRMTALGARSSSLLVYVSPCISRSHFEVGPEVAEQFESEFVHYYPGKQRPFVDLKATIVAQLTERGVPRERIEVSPHCTYSETYRFFSHRAENGRTGRLMGFIGMKA